MGPAVPDQAQSFIGVWHQTPFYGVDIRNLLEIIRIPPGLDTDSLFIFDKLERSGSDGGIFKSITQTIDCFRRKDVSGDENVQQIGQRFGQGQANG